MAVGALQKGPQIVPKVGAGHRFLNQFEKLLHGLRVLDKVANNVNVLTLKQRDRGVVQLAARVDLDTKGASDSLYV